MRKSLDGGKTKTKPQKEREREGEEAMLEMLMMMCYYCMGLRIMHIQTDMYMMYICMYGLLSVFSLVLVLLLTYMSDHRRS